MKFKHTINGEAEGVREAEWRLALIVGGIVTVGLVLAGAVLAVSAVPALLDPDGAAVVRVLRGAR